MARPGRTVVFLVRYPVDGFIWAKEEYGVRAALKAKQLVNYYSWEGNVEKPKRRITPACAALRARGIDAAVDVYAGSLKTAIRSHARKDNVHLIITKAGIGNWITRFLDGAASIFRLFKRLTFSPVMVINSRALV